MFPLKQF